MKNLIKRISKLASQEDKNKFFFDDCKSDSWKMIMYLISSNISNAIIEGVLPQNLWLFLTSFFL